MKRAVEVLPTISELDLVRELSDWLKTQRYRIRTEVSNMGQSADLVATRGRWVTVCEAKLKDWKGALTQCRAHEIIADFICVALATAAISDDLRELAERLGYGIIHYDRRGSQFQWVVKPKRNPHVWMPQRRHWAVNTRSISHGN